MGYRRTRGGGSGGGGDAAQPREVMYYAFNMANLRDGAAPTTLADQIMLQDWAKALLLPDDYWGTDVSQFEVPIPGLTYDCPNGSASRILLAAGGLYYAEVSSQIQLNEASVAGSATLVDIGGITSGQGGAGSMINMPGSAGCQVQARSIFQAMPLSPPGDLTSYISLFSNCTFPAVTLDFTISIALIKLR